MREVIAPDFMAHTQQDTFVVVGRAVPRSAARKAAFARTLAIVLPATLVLALLAKHLDLSATPKMWPGGKNCQARGAAIAELYKISEHLGGGTLDPHIAAESICVLRMLRY